MCNLPKTLIKDEAAELAMGDIPMWGTSVMDQYRKANVDSNLIFCSDKSNLRSNL